VGMMDCKRALIEAEEDFARAKQLLREQGLELMGHKGREANEGRIEAYVHHSARNSAEFIAFSRDLAMHIAAAQPRYVSPEDVPEADLEAEREVYRKQLEREGKPPEIVEKAVEGRLKKFYEEACLLKQPFVKDPAVTIEELLADLRAKTGENIYVKRFVRYEVGEA